MFSLSRWVIEEKIYTFGNEKFEIFPDPHALKYWKIMLFPPRTPIIHNISNFLKSPEKDNRPSQQVTSISPIS